jgi:hypothetical protein
MKKDTQRQIAHILYELVADILTGKAKVEQMACEVDTYDVPTRFGDVEKRRTGKSWVTLTILRPPPRDKKGGRP